MYIRRLLQLILLGISAILRGNVSCSNIISLSKDIIAHEGDTAQMKWRIRTDLQDSNKQVTCYMMQDMPDIVKGTAQGDGTFKFAITDEGENIFGQRISVQTKTNIEDLEIIFAIVLSDVETWDEYTYTCRYAGHKDTSALQVLTRLTIKQPGFPSSIEVPINEDKEMQVTLCARPKPKVTWVYAKTTFITHGTPANNTKDCYVHTYSILMRSQSECGKYILYTVTTYNQTITGHIRVRMTLQADPPSNLKIKAMQSPNCKEITWLGPNIGSCTAPLSYELAIEWNSTDVDRYRTSSTLLHVCSKQFAFLTPVMRVRTKISDRTSLWRAVNTDQEQAKSYIPWKNDKKRFEIPLIICIVIIVCLAVSLLPFVYYCYRNKRASQSKNTEKADVSTRIRYTSLEINDTERQAYDSDATANVFEDDKAPSSTDKANTETKACQIIREEEASEANEINSDTRSRHLSNDTDSYGYVGTPSNTVDNSTPDIYSTAPRGKIKQGYTRSVSESNEPQYDELQRRKLKQSISLDHYDAVRMPRVAKMENENDNEAELFQHNGPDKSKFTFKASNKTRHLSDQTTNNKAQKHSDESVPLSDLSNTSSASNLQAADDEIIYSVPKTPVKAEQEKRKQKFGDRLYENI